MRGIYRRAGALALVVTAVGGGAALLGLAPADSGVEYEIAIARRGSVERVVTVNGTLAPVNSVTVGSELSGRIAELDADFNDAVIRDQLIARIDPQIFIARVEQAGADVAAAEAGIAQRQAERQRALAERTLAKRSLERRERLVAEGHASSSELEEEEARFAMADAQVSVADALVMSARAVLEQRRAALRVAELDVARTFIRSPVSGTIIRRSVEVGQTVAASLQAPELFEIAQDLSLMKVEASVDEADIGLLREEMPCRFKVDAYPERLFHGRVEQIRMAPDVVLNVVTYKVIISTHNEDHALLPGMTANVEIVTGRRDGVVVVPNAALRFVPDSASPHTGADQIGGAPARTVWTLTDGALRPVPIVTGLADEEFTEVMQGLAESDTVVLRDTRPAS